MRAPLPDEVEEMARGEAGVAPEEEVEEPVNAGAIKPISTEPVGPVELIENEAENAGTDGRTVRGSVLIEPPDLNDRPGKKPREMTLEEYEAMLDAENAPGRFLGVGI